MHEVKWSYKQQSLDSEWKINTTSWYFDQVRHWHQLWAPCTASCSTVDHPKTKKWEREKLGKQALMSGNSLSGNPDILEMEDEGSENKEKM